uniref:30S ribosomal protein S15 n=1 Tax=Dioncophyllum thollonii TaxID=122299 RepID=A0A411JQU8_9CARY|nr:ribosomal protein S15 [Dioncophyllum thollonii]QBC67482.1 ribosomal protein S15 [Dioncophyllum thollonii]
MKIHIRKKNKYKKFPMPKKLFISVISKEKEKKEENRGSVEFQVFHFTNKIQRLTLHLELHKKDYSSQKGLRKILGKRQRMLAYLSKKNRVRYKELISQLNIRELKRP